MEELAYCSTVQGYIVSGALALFCLVLAVRLRRKMEYAILLVFASILVFFIGSWALSNLFVALNVITFAVACVPFI